jgi:hypothetical protein
VGTIYNKRTVWVSGDWGDRMGGIRAPGHGPNYATRRRQSFFAVVGSGPQCGVWKQKTIFVELSSDTPHVVTAIHIGGGFGSIVTWAVGVMS